MVLVMADDSNYHGITSRCLVCRGIHDSPSEVTVTVTVTDDHHVMVVEATSESRAQSINLNFRRHPPGPHPANIDANDDHSHSSFSDRLNIFRSQAIFKCQAFSISELV